MTPQQIWQSQTAEAPRISLEFVRRTAKDLERRTRLRNAANHSVIVLSFLVCLWAIWQHVMNTKPIMAAGVIAIALWLVYSLYLGHRLSATRATPEEAGVLDALNFQRRELERQRDGQRLGWRRGFPLVVPGFVLMILSLFLEFSAPRWEAIGIVLAGFALAFAWGTWGTRRAVRRFQQEIDALDSLTRG